MTPQRVPKSAVLAMHEMLLAEHGGSPGILSEAGLEAALASPRNHLAHANPDLFDLAAQYASAITRSHPFKDGNKRVALTVAGVFLEMNGLRLEAPERDAVNAMLALSTRELDESAFAEWLRMNSTKLPRQKRAPVRRKAPPHRRSHTPKRPRRPGR